MPLPPRAGAAFRPRFTLTIVYFFAFLLLFCAALAAPALYEVSQAIPGGPDPDAAAYDAGYEAARRVVGPRVLLAALAALATTAVGVSARLLPGFRRPA
jgi:hypothetical protein